MEVDTTVGVGGYDDGSQRAEVEASDYNYHNDYNKLIHLFDDYYVESQANLDNTSFKKYETIKQPATKVAQHFLKRYRQATKDMHTPSV